MHMLSVVISFAAMSLIALEVVWMRLFAVESFSSFGFMILSIGLLGFGVGGVVVSMNAPRFKEHRERVLYGSSLAYPLALAAAFLVSKFLPFVPQTVLQDSKQWLYIFVYYVVLSLPFLAGSLIIGTILSTMGEKIGKLYFADLLGSGLGGLLVLWAFFLVHPDYLPLVVLALFVPALAATSALFARRVGLKAWWPGLGVMAVAAATLLAFCPVRFSEYKGISYTLAAASVNHARVVEESQGPLGFLQIVEADTERSAPGLSTLAETLPPVQKGLYIDGTRVASVARPLKEEERGFMDWMLSSVPYQMKEHPRVLVVGMGGGMGVEQALHFDADSVDAVEVDPTLVRLLKERLREDTRHLFENPKVTVTVADGRDFAQKHPKTYDLIQLSFLDASGLSLAGSKSVSENYLFTVESMKGFLGALAPGGILAISSGVEEPPRAGLRVIPGAVAAWRDLWPDAPLGDSVAYLRSEFHGMLLLSSSPFSSEQIDQLNAAAWQLGVTASYFPGKTDAGMKEAAQEEDAYWSRLQEDTGVDLSGAVSASERRDPYYDLLVALTTSAQAGNAYIDEYPFDLSPTTDDHPYFSALMKSGSLDFIKAGAYNPEHWMREIPPDLWSQPMVLITLFQALAFAGLILLVPWVLARKRIRHPQMWKTFLYFSSLGVGFMFVEMVLIQKFTLFVAAPSYAAALVLSGMLVFSGLGASFTGRFAANPSRGIRWAVIGILLLTVLVAIGLTPLLLTLMGLPVGSRAAVSVLAIAPVAFFLGMPFPLGMMSLSRLHGEPAAAWGWGVNGATSVVGVVAAQFLAQQFSFTVVLLVVVGFYALAWKVFPK